MHYSAHAVYKGEWRHDNKAGLGVMTWGCRELYSGEWKQGVQDGIGEHVWLQPSLQSASGNRAFFLMYNRYGCKLSLTHRFCGRGEPSDRGNGCCMSSHHPEPYFFIITVTSKSCADARCGVDHYTLCLLPL